MTMYVVSINVDWCTGDAVAVYDDEMMAENYLKERGFVHDEDSGSWENADTGHDAYIAAFPLNEIT